MIARLSAWYGVLARAVEDRAHLAMLARTVVQLRASEQALLGEVLNLRAVSLRRKRQRDEAHRLLGAARVDVLVMREALEHEREDNRRLREELHGVRALVAEMEART